jgi:hypothetical protein
MNAPIWQCTNCHATMTTLSETMPRQCSRCLRTDFAEWPAIPEPEFNFDGETA